MTGLQAELPYWRNLIKSAISKGYVIQSLKVLSTLLHSAKKELVAKKAAQHTINKPITNAIVVARRKS